ncbi:MAG: hypothetical protein KAI66_00565 [Lentisphaeria bacterium]|nr:hypothetical protein [Lentisphaeria bacterium]
MHRQRHILVALLLIVLCSFAARAAKEATPAQKRLQAMAKEKIRLVRMVQRAAKTNMSVTDLVKASYAAIAKGNAKQAQENLDMADKLDAVADKASARRKEEKAKKYEKLAVCYRYYSKQNIYIVKAYKKLDVEAMKKGFTEVLKVERRIINLTGKRPRRNWFTPQELEKAPLSKKDAEMLMKGQRPPLATAN